jgi:hypothetical protein
VWLIKQLVRHAKSMITVIEEWVRREEEDAPQTEVK